MIELLILFALASPRELGKVSKPPGKDDKPTPAAAASFASRVAKLRKIDGLFPLYWSQDDGKLFLEIRSLDDEFLYQVGLTTGLGSNPVGLDRGQLGATHLVRFQRFGPKVLLVESNYRYRAVTDRPAERRAVEESFARSVLSGFKIEAEEKTSLLVDATEFFLRDAHGVGDALRRSKQGNYKLDPARSAIYLERTKGFPRNSEVETLLTFQIDDDPGPLVLQTTPTARAVTFRQHHSLVQLPPLDGRFTPRRFDPRVGCLDISFADYAAPLSAPLETRWITRHRLLKKDPTAAVSEVLEPITYYVDPAAPEPIRSALVEGASWWNAAFEAAGFKDAFRVSVLPDDADSMDLRYNMIHWVHRATRGWSYGDAVVDPRTGEILKGSVTLGSLRGRQDVLIASGLVHRSGGRDECLAALSPDPTYLAAFDPSTDATTMSLARLRQLAAHEVGHAIGLAHNFAASTYGRASVMDYPAPLVKLKDGKIDLSEAYASGIGAYDKLAIAYGYSRFATGTDEAKELDRVVRGAIAAGLLFVTDADSRPAGAAHPLANLWDNGNDPIAMLRHEMEVRRVGLAGFGLDNLAPGRPLSDLQAQLLPLYLHHRYQLAAAVKSLGGVSYSYAVKGTDGPSPRLVVEVVPPARQREALIAVLETLKPEDLAVPARILALVPPTAFDSDAPTRETFAGRMGVVFDPTAAAATAADLAIQALLQPERAARLIEFHARDATNPDFIEVVDALIQHTWGRTLSKDPKLGPIRRAVQSQVVHRLIGLAGDETAQFDVRAIAVDSLRRLGERIGHSLGPDLEAIHRRSTGEMIERFLKRPDPPHRPTAPLPIPPGDPIGAGAP
jgi:hypothetical protein